MDQFRDTFPQADENPLSSGGNWSNGYSNNLQVVGGIVRQTLGGDNNEESVNSISPGANAFAKFRIAAIGAGPGYAHACVRMTAPTTLTYYSAFAAVNDGAKKTAIYKSVAGVTTHIQTENASADWAVNDTLELRAIGPLLVAYKNGEALLSATDSDITLAGRVGINIAGATIGNIEVDDFSGGDYFASRSILEPKHLIAMLEDDGGFDDLDVRNWWKSRVEFA